MKTPRLPSVAPMRSSLLGRYVCLVAVVFRVVLLVVFDDQDVRVEVVTFPRALHDGAGAILEQLRWVAFVVDFDRVLTVGHLESDSRGRLLDASVDDEASETEPLTVGKVGALFHGLGWRQVVDEVLVEVAESKKADGNENHDDSRNDEPAMSHLQPSLLYRRETDRNRT